MYNKGIYKVPHMKKYNIVYNIVYKHVLLSIVTADQITF